MEYSFSTIIWSDELKKDIEPVIRVHNFITSGKMWSIIIALGGIIGGIIKYLQYNG